MTTKITPDHLSRGAVVYVRQSTMAQVTGNLESQRRQYDLAGAAKSAGFASVTVIDEDLGRSGSGSMERPGFEKLVAMVCTGDCPSSDDLRLIRDFEKGGSGSSGLEFKRPAIGAASDGLRRLHA